MVDSNSTALEAIVVVDPLSSGLLMATKLAERGYSVIRVNSRKLPDGLDHGHSSLKCAAVLNHDDHMESEDMESEEAVAKTVAALLELTFNIKAVITGSELGVELADVLSVAMGFTKNNGLELSESRRDKFMMIEQLHKTGVPAALQTVATCFDDVTQFLSGAEMANMGDIVVLKPRRSAGSDGVSIVNRHDLERLREAYFNIVGKENALGEMNRDVLVQEFLAGEEYVVDTVSYDGVHKVVAIWKYDKRPANGGPVVYYGMRLFESEDGQIEEMLREYVSRVIDVLGVRYGPAHSEVILTPRGPRLVETGSRPHGGDGTFVKMVDRALGYNQLDVTLDVALDLREKFELLPDRPQRLKSHAMEVNLICWRSGTLRALPGLQAIRRLESYVGEEMLVAPGDEMHLTVDFLTTPGSFQLVHEDKNVMKRDEQFVRDIERDGLFSLVEDDGGDEGEQLMVGGSSDEVYSSEEEETMFGTTTRPRVLSSEGS